MSFRKVVFSPQYPYKPPSILMLTPSGRFAIQQKLCLSISDFHPESWCASKVLPQPYDLAYQPDRRPQDCACAPTSAMVQALRAHQP